MAKRKLCSCALVNGHFPNCVYKNMAVGEELMIDFEAFKKILKEMEKRVLRENRSGKRKTRIFIAPVIKKRKRKTKNRPA